MFCIITLTPCAFAEIRLIVRISIGRFEMGCKAHFPLWGSPSTHFFFSSTRCLSKPSCCEMFNRVSDSGGVNLATTTACTGALVGNRESSGVIGAEAASLFARDNHFRTLKGGLLCADDSTARIARGFHRRVEGIESLSAFTECQKGCIIDCSGHLSTASCETYPGSTGLSGLFGRGQFRPWSTAGFPDWFGPSAGSPMTCPAASTTTVL